MSSSKTHRSLISGNNPVQAELLAHVLQERGHLVAILPQITSVDIEKSNLVFLTGNPGDISQNAKKTRSVPDGERITIIAVLSDSTVSMVRQEDFEDIDEMILESLSDTKRLHLRLTLIEKASEHQFERYRAELEVTRSMALSQTILDVAVDGIITITDKGTIRSFNPAAERIFGYKKEEVIGNNVNFLMPTPYKQKHDNYLKNYLKTGHKKIIDIGREVMGRKKDRSVFPLYLAVSEMNISGERLFVGMVKDISEQRQLEQELLRTTEYERRRIGQDLHDGLGQMLTGIGLMTRSLARSLHKKKISEHEDATEIAELIKQADEYARGLSRGLIPVEFEPNGLAAAIQRLVRNAKKMFQITCTFEEYKIPIFEESMVVEHLYRIAQEAINNAVRHGKASDIVVTIDGDHSIIRMIITDDGVGFRNDWRQNDGMGVRIMQFRARLIGASIDIISSPGTGTSVTCTLPRSSVPFYLPE